jgi:hypothetical protein
LAWVGSNMIFEKKLKNIDAQNNWTLHQTMSSSSRQWRPWW